MANILIIGGEEHSRDFLKMALELSGHAVRETCDPEDGVLFYRAARFDVVICDLASPKSLDSIAELRRFDRSSKIIALSGGPGVTANGVALALQYGAAAILRKPFNMTVLADEVRDVLAPGIDADAAPTNHAASSQSNSGEGEDNRLFALGLSETELPFPPQVALATSTQSS